MKRWTLLPQSGTDLVIYSLPGSIFPKMPNYFFSRDEAKLSLLQKCVYVCVFFSKIVRQVTLFTTKTDWCRQQEDDTG